MASPSLCLVYFDSFQVIFIHQKLQSLSGFEHGPTEYKVIPWPPRLMSVSLHLSLSLGLFFVFQSIFTLLVCLLFPSKHETTTFPVRKIDKMSHESLRIKKLFHFQCFCSTPTPTLMPVTGVINAHGSLLQPTACRSLTCIIINVCVHFYSWRECNNLDSQGATVARQLKVAGSNLAPTLTLIWSKLCY